MAKTKKNDSELVTELIEKHDAGYAKLLEAIRQVILKTDKQIGEQIKWNSPAFYYTGEMKPFDPKEYKRDIVVYNLRNPDYVLLVFPSGAKVKDDSGLLEGDYTDGRRLAKIADLKDLKSKEKALQKVIRSWLKLIDK
ncbi:MAG: DUF1801 domain-containing protein [Bacteroidota bacterium]|nr:DUF1801 domain-containing protein [Bacteroidota bacterium]